MEIIVNTKFIQRLSGEVGNFPAVSVCNNNVQPLCHETDTSKSSEACFRVSENGRQTEQIRLQAFVCKV